MKRSLSIQLSLSVVAFVSATLLTGPVYAGSPTIETDADTAALIDAGVTPEYVILQFKDPAAATYEGGVRGYDKTKPENGRWDPNSRASQNYLRHLAGVHANYRSWLKRNARKAEIVRDYKVTFNGVAVKLNGNNGQKVASFGGVKDWAYSTVYSEQMDVSVPFIGADVLQAPSPANAGNGIKVGVIDSGIQSGHPFFACKTVQHHGPYFSGQAPNPPNSPFPIIISTHGTHVAGTVGGCVSDLSVIDPSGPIKGQISGLVPGAALHDYNVFPGIGSAFWNGIRKTGNVSAYSHDIADAIEDAVVDGMDVINMSLGGKVQGLNDYLANFSDSASDAGVVVAAAAGNSGPDDSTAESPGTGRNVIAAGAISNPHFLGIPVTVGATSYGGVAGEFANFGTVTNDYTVTTPANGCSAITEDLTGKIALINRGVCSFSTKIRNAQLAGAVGVLMVNSRVGDAIPMGQDGTPDQPTIPALMLSRDDGNAIKPSGTATIDGTAQAEFITNNGDILAGFSSHGPAPFSRNIKPDVCAPGVNVYSSVFNFGASFDDVTYSFEMFAGTSMASPHVAGGSALLLFHHPNWSPADVRSALVNTAKRPVYNDVTGASVGVLSRGGGRIDLEAANDTPLTLNPAMANFGFWSGNVSVLDSQDIHVRNVSGASQTCNVTVTGPAIVSVAPSSFTLAAGASATLHVAIDAGKSGQYGSGDYDGDITINTDKSTLLAPWFVRIDRQGKH